MCVLIVVVALFFDRSGYHAGAPLFRQEDIFQYAKPAAYLGPGLSRNASDLIQSIDSTSINQIVGLSMAIGS